MALFQMDWAYVYRDKSGRLRDRDDGGLLNDNWPSFDSDDEAEKYLEDEDIRGTVVGCR
tara:strand:- start:148 stop:324 length:177 start_codon:yes stop_codon:yes gene_type:complete